MGFRISLDAYSGPMDLLLFLVRRHEIDILDIPIAPITEQYLTYLEVLRELSVDDVADFIEMSGTLLEIKSRVALPNPEEDEASIDDPREELVQRLLDYKKYKDAASLLEEQSRQWQQRFPRLANDLPARETDLQSQPIAEVELWDLVSAFGRIIRDQHLVKGESVVYDETPIHLHMQRIHARIVQAGRVAFSDLFDERMHKSTMIGVFLAILELARHYNVHADQPELHGEIWLLPGPTFREEERFRPVEA